MSVPRVVVLHHIACEGLGTLEPVLAAELDLEILPAYAAVRPYRERIEELVQSGAYEGVIALGGPMAVYEREEFEALEYSLRLLRAALHRDVPVLGICLGAQLLAYSLGAQVVPGRTLGLRKEIGWYPVELSERGKVDPAFHGFRSGERVFHWHGDTFSLPERAWRLAGSTLYPNQAFRVGRWTYGVQFHMEVTAEMVAEWVQLYASELDTLDYIDREVVLAGAAKYAPRLAGHAEVFGKHFRECVLTFTREAPRAALV